jgi:hypothetical protein
MARRLIGPKVQAAVPAHVAHYITSRARTEGVDEAVVTRQLVLAGYATLKPKDTDLAERVTLPGMA